MTYLRLLRVRTFSGYDNGRRIFHLVNSFRNFKLIPTLLASEEHLLVRPHIPYNSLHGIRISLLRSGEPFSLLYMPRLLFRRRLPCPTAALHSTCSLSDILTVVGGHNRRSRSARGSVPVDPWWQRVLSCPPRCSVPAGHWSSLRLFTPRPHSPQNPAHSVPIVSPEPRSRNAILRAGYHAHSITDARNGSQSC